MSENHQSSRVEPSRKRVAVYVEADDFFNLQKKVFGDSYLSFNPSVLAKELCAQNETWDLVAVSVYISSPSKLNNSRWHSTWRNIASKWRECGCAVSVSDHDMTFGMIHSSEGDHKIGKLYVNSTARMNLVMDVMEACHQGIADVILFISGDKLLKPLSDRIKQISHMEKRWIKVVSAVPFKEAEGDRRPFFSGVPNSDWMKITPAMYEKAIALDTESESDK